MLRKCSCGTGWMKWVEREKQTLSADGLVLHDKLHRDLCIAGCDSLRWIGCCCHKFFCPSSIPTLFTDFRCHEEFSFTTKKSLCPPVDGWDFEMSFESDWVHEGVQRMSQYCCEVMSDWGLKNMCLFHRRPLFFLGMNQSSLSTGALKRVWTHFREADNWL